MSRTNKQVMRSDYLELDRYCGISMPAANTILQYLETLTYPDGFLFAYEFEKAITANMGNRTTHFYVYLPHSLCVNLYHFLNWKVGDEVKSAHKLIKEVVKSYV